MSEDDDRPDDVSFCVGLFFWLILALINYWNLKIVLLSAQCIKEAPSAIRYASPPRGVRRTGEGQIREDNNCDIQKARVVVGQTDIPCGWNTPRGRV